MGRTESFATVKPRTTQHAGGKGDLLLGDVRNVFTKEEVADDHVAKCTLVELGEGGDRCVVEVGDEARGVVEEGVVGPGGR